jgi:hypothetical protein
MTRFYVSKARKQDEQNYFLGNIFFSAITHVHCTQSYKYRENDTLEISVLLGALVVDLSHSCQSKKKDNKIIKNRVMSKK